MSKVSELTAQQARYESLCALAKNEEEVKKYEAILEKILYEAKQGSLSVMILNEEMGQYAKLCLARDGFHFFETSVYTHVEWDRK